MNKRNITQNISCGALGLTLAAGLSLAAGTAAFAQDDSTSMAPPVQSSAPEGLGAGTNAAADSVFNWQEIPANQQVPLTRAAFDQGGYQLYDTVGETIVVPFTNNNLYVMKFATSQNGTLYFENQGGYPVLYVPKGGFLENATVSGARWYPFGQNFHPEEPVFLGIAPSYPEFVDLGWYPNTYFYGGFYGGTPFLDGGVFLPTVGLFFSIGGHPYYGWNSYHNYFFDHPGFYHTGYFNRNFYHYAGNNYRIYAPGRRFGGGGYAFNHGYAGGGGYNHSYAGRSSGGSFSSGRTFRGGSSYGSGNYSVNRSVTVNNYGGGGQRFGGSQSSAGGRTFRGASNYGGQNYSGGSHSYSGGQSYGGSRSFGSQSGSPTSGSSRSFGGGTRTFGGSTRSFSGGQSSRVSSGGTRSSGNSGGGSRNSGGGRGR